MTVSEVLIKIVGIIFIVVGAALLLSSIGINLIGTDIGVWWLDILGGVLFLAAGIYLVRGGNVGL